MASDEGVWLKVRGVASGEGCSPRREGVASVRGVVLGERVWLQVRVWS